MRRPLSSLTTSRPSVRGGLVLLALPLVFALAACAPGPVASGRAVSRIDLGGAIRQVDLNEDGSRAVAVVGERMVVVDVGAVTAHDAGPGPALSAELHATGTPGPVAYDDEGTRVLWRRDDGHGGVETVLSEAGADGEPTTTLMVVDLGGAAPTWSDAPPALSGDGNTVAVPAGSVLTVERVD